MLYTSKNTGNRLGWSLALSFSLTHTQMKDEIYKGKKKQSVKFCKTFLMRLASTELHIHSGNLSVKREPFWHEPKMA